MAHDAVQIVLGKQGRIVLPASIRYHMGLEPGAELIVRTEGDRLIIEPREVAEARLKSRFSTVKSSLADDLIAERRSEAARE